LSNRDEQETLLERGIDVAYESTHQWYRKFGHDYANQLRRWQPRLGDK
jgi:putative transposase